MSNKSEKLEQIEKEVKTLEESPLYTYRKKNDYEPVIGSGDIDAEIMLIGEAPGEQEAKSGEPFVGAAGRILNDLFEAIGLDRDDVYITNVVKDRPPENRDPRVGEVELYAPFLWRQIAIIRPKVIVTLGRFAMDQILEHFELEEAGGKISDLHGTLLEAEAPYGSVAILPLYHPAVSFYSPDRKEDLQKDFELVKQFIDSDESD